MTCQAIVGVALASLAVTGGGCDSGPASSGPPPRVATFERGFGAVDGRSADGGNLRIVRAHGRPAVVRAGYSGRQREGFARVWHSVRVRPAGELWYGADFLIPAGPVPRYMALLRWDDRRSRGSAGDIGGIEVSHGRRARLYRQDYQGANYARLADDFVLPRDRWFTLEVHQRLSDRSGVALSEAYLDGERVSRSRVANSRGYAPREVRFGLVSFDAAPPRAGAIFFDRATVGARSAGESR